MKTDHRLSSWLYKLLVGVIPVVVMGAECHRWINEKYRYSVCSPEGWYREAKPSGIVFFCDDERGGCWRRVGYGPAAAHATITLTPAKVTLSPPPKSLDEFAKRVAAREESSRFDDARPRRMKSNQVLTVRQRLTTSAINDVPIISYIYFVRNGSLLLQIALEFNEGDQRSTHYRQVAEEIAASVAEMP
jgi:hypothetical protein